ncbi:DUF1366 domain-containing protein [Streptococcus cristatus]|uniref:DUF1366 domain-containing protein n=1 Tax=Streptococcus cristatus TaxID=45634 RepID=UPI0039C01F4F
MRNWNVVGRYPIYDEENKITHTEIAIASTSAGYATFTERVLGDHANKSEKELIDLALEALFKSEFSDRAMAESVQKIEEMDQAIKASNALMAKMETAIARAEEAANENRRLVKTVTLTLNQIIANGGTDEEEEHESSNQSNQDQN